MFWSSLLANPPLWLQFAIVGAWLGMVGLLAEWVYRRQQFGAEISRKVVHIGVGNVVLFAWWLHIPAWVGVGASLLFSIITFLSYRLPILPSINGIGRKSLGTFFYAVSIGILVGCFWSLGKPYYAALGILIMTWGDGLAALIGQRFGQHLYKLWDMQKSWEGTFTMFVVSFGVSSLILLGVFGNVWQTWVISLLIAPTAALLEAFSKFGIDNLTVPLGSAALALVLEWLLLV